MFADDLEGKCFVLQMKDYLKGRPLLEGIDFLLFDLYPRWENA
jgi:hypothetical protein